MIARSDLFNNSIISLIFFAISLTVTINVSGQLLQDSKRVIFLKETSVLFDMIKDTSLQRFTPTFADIDIVDIVLNQHFLSITLKEDKHLNLQNYFRQYVGISIRGRKHIFINASCRQPDYFLKNTYYPKGGGQCYFRTLIDLVSKKVFQFYVNAPK